MRLSVVLPFINPSRFNPINRAVVSAIIAITDVIAKLKGLFHDKAARAHETLMREEA